MEIPCTIMDEHKDGYYHWNEMIERGWLNPKGNYLLHIDHHEDMVGGAYDWDMRQMPRTAAEAYAFTEKCLGIADFILPAIWQGIFDTCHLVMNLFPIKTTSEERVLRWNPKMGLVNDPYVPFLYAEKKRVGDPGCRFFTLRKNGLSDEEDIKGARHIVLDVDLDYFCWDNSLKSVPEKRIEITKEAYEAYRADCNHPFRLLPRQLVHVKEIHGRFYLIYEEAAARDDLPDEQIIRKRIDRLFAWLTKCGIVPDAIDVCRSGYSGYLPAERAAFTEAQFMKKLREVYPVRELVL